jgi:alpha-glucosidase
MIKNNRYQLLFATLSFLFFALSGFGNNTPTALKSPDGRTVFNLNLKTNSFSYSIQFENSLVIQNAPLGLERDDASFSNNMVFISQKTSKIRDEYQLEVGKRLHINAEANQIEYLLKNANGDEISLQVRAYNEGIAFRYAFSQTDNKKHTIVEEKTGFKFPLTAKTWIMPYDTISTFTPSYETYYSNGVPAGTVSPNKEGWSFPALFNVNCKWVLITEAGLNETYCASHLQPNPTDGLYAIRFPEKQEAMGLFSQTPSSTLPWATPWRVIALGNSCGDILESSLVTHVAEPAKFEDLSWIKSGKASWSWWSDNGSPRNFESLKKYIDLSVTMGWEYSLVDANWGSMMGGDFTQLVAYANSKNIGIWLWYNSGGEINKVSEQPRDIMYQAELRRAEFAKLHKMGVKGVKIDFFNSDKQPVIKLYLDILKDAAENHLMVNFHGCTLPRGWERTYPNLISMEAVRGAENYIFDKNYPSRAVWHNTIYPFTRNVVGPMDYTPVTLSNQTYPHLTSNAYELALSVVYQSGILHFADRADSYLNLDNDTQLLLKNLPTVWDDTKFIAGEPGKYVVVARKKEGKWYVAGINGQNFPQKITLKKSAFKLSRLITDGTGNMKLDNKTIEKQSQNIEIEMIKYGGFIAY